MTRTAYIVWTLIVLLLLLLTVPYLFQMLGIIFFPKSTTLLRQLSIYQWVSAGIVAYGVFYKLLPKASSIHTNVLLFETFSHELTHFVMCLLLLREVRSFHVEKSVGRISSSGNHGSLYPVVSLAPYCFPLYTYILLSLRSLMDFHGLFIFDIIIGMSIAFHAINFKKDTGNYQTDINQYPLFFSYLYIFTALVINLAVIWVSFFPRYNVFASFWRLVCAWGSNLATFFQWLF